MLSSWIIIFILFIWILFFNNCLSGDKSYLNVEPCESNRCRLPYCYCSNQTIPGGLKVRDTPQFIAITVDGPTNNKTYQLLKEIFFSKKFNNPDGLCI